MYVLEVAFLSFHLIVVQDKEIPNSYFTTEVRAGITTFFTMAYIISVNVSLLKPLFMGPC